VVADSLDVVLWLPLEYAWENTALSYCQKCLDSRMDQPHNYATCYHSTLYVSCCRNVSKDDYTPSKLRVTLPWRLLESGPQNTLREVHCPQGILPHGTLSTIIVIIAWTLPPTSVRSEHQTRCSPPETRKLKMEHLSLLSPSIVRIIPVHICAAGLISYLVPPKRATLQRVSTGLLRTDVERRRNRSRRYGAHNTFRLTRCHIRHHGTRDQ
jgi:hypothetical protein